MNTSSRQGKPPPDHGDGHRNRAMQSSNTTTMSETTTENTDPSGTEQPENTITESDVKDVERAKYECTLCGEAFDRPAYARRHVTSNNDSIHKDREGSEPGIVEITNSDVLEEVNRSVGLGDEVGDAMIDDRMFRVLHAIWKNPTMTQQAIGEKIDTDPTEISRLLRERGFQWSERMELVDQAFPFPIPDEPPADEEPEAEAEPEPEAEAEAEDEDETVTVTAGRGIYTGPSKGIDLTSYPGEKNIFDRPARTPGEVVEEPGADDGGEETVEVSVDDLWADERADTEEEADTDAEEVPRAGTVTMDPETGQRSVTLTLNRKEVWALLGLEDEKTEKHVRRALVTKLMEAGVM